eukprot:278035_1
MKNCQFTSRHQKQNGDDNKLEPELNFYKQVMDSFHFFVSHLYHCGLRTISNDDNINDDDDEIENEDEYFDKVFYRLNKQIKQRKHLTKTFERFNNNKNNKFTLISHDNDDSLDNETYLDAMYEDLRRADAIGDNINKLREYLKFEEFDSEAIISDLDYDIGQCDGNVSYHMKNREFVDTIANFIEHMDVSSSSFNVGLRFYYWNFYQSINDIPAQEQWIYNMNDHSGYSISELFVKQKYGSFKEEISNYPHITVKQYQNEIVTKINGYIYTDIVKNTKSNTYKCNNLHYGITKETPLNFHNLLSLILYT